MKKLSFISSIFISIFLVFGCDNSAEEILPEIQDELSISPKSQKPLKVTGDVQVAWKGKGGSGMVEEKLVFVSFDAQESVTSPSKKEPVSAKGYFFFSVLKSDNTVERNIEAKVLEVGFGHHPDGPKAWIFAEVTSDSKCGASDHSGCDGSDHTDGGCSDDDDGTHDGGCTHDTGSIHDDTGTDGGCDHDDTETDSGCDHDDTDTDHDEGSGGKPDDNGGKGKQCRVGQHVVAKMHDKGSPGISNGITWKWFDNLDGFSIESEPKSLCKKTILAGNLTVHIPQKKNNSK